MDGVGFVLPSFARGALLLRDRSGAYHRLSWGEMGPQAEGADRRRALVPGKYVLTTYRILLPDEEGVDWHVSGTARALREVVVKPGEELTIEIDPTIRIRKRPTPKGMSIAIQGDGGAGLSIYKGDRRIPITGRLVGTDGFEIKTGPMRYG